MKILLSFPVASSLIVFQLLCHLISLSSAESILTPHKVLPPQSAVVSGILSGPSAAKYGPFHLAPGKYYLFVEWITPGAWMSMQPQFLLFFPYIQSLPFSHACLPRAPKKSDERHLTSPTKPKETTLAVVSTDPAHQPPNPLPTGDLHSLAPPYQGPPYAWVNYGFGFTSVHSYELQVPQPSGPLPPEYMVVLADEQAFDPASGRPRGTPSVAEARFWLFNNADFPGVSAGAAYKWFAALLLSPAAARNMMHLPPTAGGRSRSGTDVLLAVGMAREP